MKFSVNEQVKRFELDVQGQTAVIEFTREADNVMQLTHTEVPKSLEGKGIGKAIVESALQYIRDNDMKVAPICRFVSAYIKKHPEWQSLVAFSFTN